MENLPAIDTRQFSYAERVFKFEPRDRLRLSSTSVEFYWAFMDFEKLVLEKLCSIVADRSAKNRLRALRHVWQLSVVYFAANDTFLNNLPFKAMPTVRDSFPKSAAFWTMTEACQLAKLSPESAEFFYRVITSAQAISKSYMNELQALRPDADLSVIREAVKETFFFSSVEDNWLLSQMKVVDQFFEDVCEIAKVLVDSIQQRLRAYIFSDNAHISPFAFLRADGEVDWEVTYPFLRAFGVKKIAFSAAGGTHNLLEPMRGVDRFIGMVDSYNRAYNRYNSTKYCLHPHCKEKDHPLPPAIKGEINLHAHCREPYKKLRKYHNKKMTEKYAFQAGGPSSDARRSGWQDVIN